MSESTKSSTIRPRSIFNSHCDFAIISSQYNLDLTQALVDAAFQEIEALEHGAKISLVWAPGTFEIPVLAKFLASCANHDAIIAIGVILEGETSHAKLIAHSVTHALQNVAVETGVPVIDGIVAGSDYDVVRARCLETEKNRGIEAARAAISVARTIRELRKTI